MPVDDSKRVRGSRCLAAQEHYENSSTRVQVGGEGTAAIQMDTGTVQGSVLPPLLFDFFINALLRMLDSTGISHKVRNAPDWNHQAFAYVCARSNVYKINTTRVHVSHASCPVLACHPHTRK